MSGLSKRWKETGLLLVILAAAAGFRIARINYDSLTFDEQWHLELSTGRGSPHVRLPRDTFIPAAPAVTSLKGAPPWYKVWTNMDYVVHPPLYCTLLRLWRDIFGESDIAARSFSIVCSLIAIVLMFGAARELNGLVPAAWAAAIFAVAPTQVYLAEQVRGYDLLVALGMGAVLVLVRLERACSVPPLTSRRGRADAIALGLCVLGMMLTHYFAIGPCTAIGLYVVLRLRGVIRRNALIALIMAAMIYAASWGPFLLRQWPYFQETADSWLIEHDSKHLAWTLARLASWCWWMVARYSPNPPLHLFSAVLLFIPLILLQNRRNLLLWYLWLVGTLGFVAALDLVRGTAHLKFARYVGLAAPAVFVLLTGCLWMIRGWMPHLLAGVVVLAALIGSRLAYTSEGEPDWRPLGLLIDQNVTGDETLIFYHGTSPRWYDEIFYLGTAHYSHAFPRPIIKLSGPADPSLLRQVPTKTAWLICGPLDRPLSEIIPGASMVGSPMVQPNLAFLIHIRLNTPQYADRLGK